MADNVSITEGSGAKIIASDDVGGAQYQRVKWDVGADGAASPLVRGQQSSANSLPVVLSTEQQAFVDGLETLLGDTNTLLTTLAGVVSSARAAVNLIAGQAGITAGAGAVGAATPRVTLASDDPGVAHLATLANATEYETVAASQTAQILGATGGVGDLLVGLLIVPATTTPGAVTVADGNGAAISVFAGGASSVTSLVPFFVPLGAKTVNATTPGWKVTTGANVSVIGVGNFT